MVFIYTTASFSISQNLQSYPWICDDEECF